MATSKLEKYLSSELYTRFGHLSIRQNYRPDWMEGLELDFFIQELNLAAEVQGEQHYNYVEHFHKTKDDFEKQKDRDIKKRLICNEKKIKLIEVFTEKDADLFVLLVKEKCNQVEISLPTGIPIKKKNNKQLKSKIKSYNKCLRLLYLYENNIIQADQKEVHMWNVVVSKGVKIKGVIFR